MAYNAWSVVAFEQPTAAKWNILGANDAYFYTFITNLLSGWMAGTTWTYASATTFTLSGDYSEVFSLGDKIRLKQGGGYKYFYVVSATYSAPNTTVTVTGGSSYTLANASITDNYYSKAATPAGFPVHFAYATTPGGFSANPTLTTVFSLVGRTMFVFCYANAVGTSNSTSFTITVPITSANIALLSFSPIQTHNNGATGTAAGMATVGQATTTMNLYRDWNQGAWTNSGNKYSSFLAAIAV